MWGEKAPFSWTGEPGLRTIQQFSNRGSAEPFNLADLLSILLRALSPV